MSSVQWMVDDGRYGRHDSLAVCAECVVIEDLVDSSTFVEFEEFEDLNGFADPRG